MFLLFALMTYSDHKQFKRSHVLHSYRVVLWEKQRVTLLETSNTLLMKIQLKLPELQSISELEVF